MYAKGMISACWANKSLFLGKTKLNELETLKNHGFCENQLLRIAVYFDIRGVYIFRLEKVMKMYQKPL